MTVKAEPTPTVLGAVTTKWVAAAGVTAMPVWEPVIEDVTVSVAVIDQDEPTVSRMTPKVPVPPDRVLLEGRTAFPSLLVMATMPP